MALKKARAKPSCKTCNGTGRVRYKYFGEFACGECARDPISVKFRAVQKKLKEEGK